MESQTARAATQGTGLRPYPDTKMMTIMAATEQDQLNIERERNDRKADAAQPSKPRKKVQGKPMHNKATDTVVKTNQLTNLSFEVFIGSQFVT
jgi:hypothetical protein